MHHSLTEQVIGLAIRVHKELGPGLLESVYESCLAFELRQAGIPFSASGCSPRRVSRLSSGYRVPRRSADRRRPDHRDQGCRQTGTGAWSAVADLFCAWVAARWACSSTSMRSCWKMACGASSDHAKRSPH